MQLDDISCDDLILRVTVDRGVGDSVKCEEMRHTWVVVYNTVAEFASIALSQKTTSREICVPSAHAKCIAVIMFGGCALHM